MNHELGDIEPSDSDILASQIDGLFDEDAGEITAESLEADFQETVRLLGGRITHDEIPKKIA